MKMRAVRRRAGEILAVHGNRLLLIEALAISLLFLSLYSSLSYACAAVVFFAPESEALLIGVIVGHALLTGILTFFFTVPTCLGLFCIAGKMTAGEEAALADLFFAFSSRRAYVRALALSFRLLLRGAIVWLVCESTYLLFVYVVPPILLNAMLCGVLIGAEVLMGLWLLFRIYPEIYAAFRFPDEPLPATRAHAYERVPSPVARGRRYFFGFFPYLLLGFLTVGILWIADTIPRMLVAYFVDCEG